MTTSANVNVGLSLPEHMHGDDADDMSRLTPDGTIFVSEQDQFLLVPTTPAFSTVSSNKSNKSNYSNDSNDSTEFDKSQLGLSLVKITTPHPRESELLDDIQYEELNKLKYELQTAKNELKEMTTSHNDQIDHFQRMLKKVKAEGEFIGTIKHKKKIVKHQKKITNYESELNEINSKLKATQNLHVSELKQIKKSELKYKLEIKLKDQKMKALNSENLQLKKQIEIIKQNNETNMNNLRKEYDDQMEKEINKRIQQISDIKQQKNAEIKILNNEKLNASTLEMSTDVTTLNEEIKRLERRYEEEQNMFFKHSEIMEYKLERETKDKKRLEKKLLETKFEFETEIKTLNKKCENIKKLLTEQNEINIHLQNNLVILSEQNKRYKQMESDYKLVAENIENDYQQMNNTMENLKNTAKEKENELTEVKQFLQQKESENKNLKTNIRSHNTTIIQLENVLQGLKDNEEKYEDKKKEIQNLNVAINDAYAKTPISGRDIDEQNAFQFESQAMGEPMSKVSHHGYTISYLSNGNDNQIQTKHINQLENIKNEYNELINKMKNQHQKTREMLYDAEISKVESIKNFTVAIDQMRSQIRKQCKLFRGINVNEFLDVGA